MQRIDVVRIRAQRFAQRRNGLVLAPGPQVIECDCDLQSIRILFEPCLERRVRFGAASECSERLAQLLAGERQAGVESDCVLKAGHGFFESLLQRQRAAEVFVKVRVVGPQRQRKPRGLLGLCMATLLAQRMAEQTQVVH